MKSEQKPHRSHLFTMRLWWEEMANGPPEWRGKVQHVLSGTTRHFRDWATPIAFLQEMAYTKHEIEG